MGLIRRKNRRRRAVGERLVRAAERFGRVTRRSVKVMLALGFLIAVPLGVYQGYQALMRSDYFMISAIQIEGNERLTRDQVLELTGLDERRNILIVDDDRLRERLLSSPWITEAEVELELPRTVRISLQEREPAGWLFDHGLFRVDVDGFVIEPGQAADLEGPLITGIEAVTRQQLAESNVSAARLLAVERTRSALDIAHYYEAQGLTGIDTLAEIHFDDLLGYSLLTRDLGLEARLGHDRFVFRLQRLRDVLQTLEGQQLHGRYILVDGEGALTAVAVGPARPGRGESGPVEGGFP